jgi:ABC-2 type transport system ATP-binding protein
VAIIKGGRIIAEGKPDELAAAEAMVTAIRFRLPPGMGAADLPAAVADRIVNRNGRLELTTSAPVADLALLCGWAVDRGVDLADLEVHRPTLEDVYLELTASAAPAELEAS